MKGKLWTILAIFVVASMVLMACRPAATPTPTPRPTPVPPTATPKPKLKITVATDATWPPFEYVDETTKELVGFDIDLMNAIAAAADFEVEYLNVAWDPLLAGMATGEYDAAISAMTITEERAKQWHFSDPYWSAGQLIAVRIDETDIKGPEDLAGKVAGAQLGTTGAIYIEENLPDTTLKTYDEISQAFLDLINGQIDAVVADDPLVEAMVKKYADVVWVGGVLTAEEYGIAVRKGAPEILEAINRGLQIVKDRGLIAELKTKWIEVEAPEVMKITVATDATWPPFEYVDETTKELVGFDIDLMNAIAAAADFEVEYLNVAWDPLLAGMATGEYDAAISAMTITEERAKQWHFSDPYWSAGQLIAVRIDETTIKGPEDLAGKVAGAQLGTTGAIYIEENLPDTTLKTYDEISQAFLDLINGQIDAVVADDPLVEAMVKKYADVVWVGGVLTAEEYGIAVRKGAPEILEAINRGLQIVKDQGLIAELKTKWIEVEAPEVMKITVATDATWPPFEYVDETTKELVGFDIDLMNAIAAAADFEVEYLNVAWDPLLAGMATGEYDAAISAMTITEERAKQWHFSDPYWSAGQLIAVRIDETDIKGPEDLAGKVAGAQLGTTGAIYIEENLPDTTLKTYDEISQAFLDLINGQIDAVVADDPLVEAMVKKYADVISVGGVLTAEEYGIAVRKGAPEILEAINRGLQIVKDQGLIAELKEKWLEEESE